jgi:hypothetical protein
MLKDPILIRINPYCLNGFVLGVMPTSDMLLAMDDLRFGKRQVRAELLN